MILANEIWLGMAQILYMKTSMRLERLSYPTYFIILDSAVVPELTDGGGEKCWRYCPELLVTTDHIREAKSGQRTSLPGNLHTSNFTSSSSIHFIIIRPHPGLRFTYSRPNLTLYCLIVGGSVSDEGELY